MTLSGPSPSDRPPAAIANGRLGRIVRGYLGACFIAAWGLAGGLILEDLAAGHRLSGRLSDFGVVVGGFFVVMLVSAAPLATAAIIATESYRVRLIWPFLGCGAVIGLIIEVVAAMLVRAPANAPRLTAYWTIFVIAAVVGALAGAVYWAIAVRGSRLPQARQER
jgi:hypothetical protein